MQDLDLLKMEAFNQSRLLQFYEKMEFWDLKKRVKERSGVIRRPDEVSTSNMDLSSDDNVDGVPF